MLGFIFYNTPIVLIIIASIWGLVCFRQLPPSLRALVLLLCFDAIMECTGSLLQYLKIPNLFLFPIVIVGEAGLLFLLYVRALQSAWLQRLAPWVVGCLALYALLDTLLVPGTVRFYPSLQVMSDLLSLYLGSMYFRKQLNELQVARLERDPLFWISAGLVLTSTSNLLISLFSNYLLNNYSQQFNSYIWRIHTALIALLYICYCLALWLRPRQDQQAVPAVRGPRSTW